MSLNFCRKTHNILQFYTKHIHYGYKTTHTHLIPKRFDEKKKKKIIYNNVFA